MLSKYMRIESLNLSEIGTIWICYNNEYDYDSMNEYDYE